MWDRTIRKEDGSFGLQRTVSIQRSQILSCSNSPENLPPAIESRALIMTMTSTTKSHRQKQRLISGNAAVATANVKGVTTMKSAWRKVLQTYSALAVRYTGLEAVGAMPAIDQTLYLVWTMMLEAETNIKVPPRRTLAILNFARSICIFDMIRSWQHVIGPSFKYDRGVETAFYAYRSFLTAEHVVAAWSIVQNSTNTTNQYRDLMAVLKEQCIRCEDGSNPVVQGSYYVSKCARRDHIIATVEKFLPRFGHGLVCKLFDMANAGVTEDGHANIMIDSFNGSQRYFFHRKWMAGVLTAPEYDIVQCLEKISKDPRKCCRMYDDEEHVLVFRSSIASIFLRPHDDDVMHHPELSKYTSEQLRLAIQMLQERQTPEGQYEVMFSTGAIDVAKYIGDECEESEPSTLFSTKHKLRRSEVVPLVVHTSIFQDKDTVVDDDTRKTSDLVQKYFAVAGSYEGMQVFCGVRSGNNRAMPYNMMRVPDEGGVADDHDGAGEGFQCVVQNPLWRSRPADDMLLSEEGDVDGAVEEGMPAPAQPDVGPGPCDTSVDDTMFASDAGCESVIFPSHEEQVTLDSRSKVQERVSDWQCRRLCLSEEYIEPFQRSFKDS